jgi:UDP-N-acetylglucosamine 2-epimerase (non-hydrolysing)
MKIISVVGARPNFMKVAPIIRAINKYNKMMHDPGCTMQHILVHTGQHYDHQMSKVFFQDLELPEPDIYLGVGSGTHAEQTGKVMIEFEKVLMSQKPDLLVVVGDVNSTLACSLASVKLHIPVAHVEAGLRSFDRTMPEEINRVLTDQISDYLFTPSPDADENLRKEGVSADKIFLVGDVMVDSLLAHKEKAKESKILHTLGLTSQKSEVKSQKSRNNCALIQPYALLTLHRPSNVDDKDALLKIVHALTEIGGHIPVIFPMHPRTKKQIEAFGLQEFFQTNDYQSGIKNSGTYTIDPLGYLDFLNLMMHATLVLTDSGGIQEETTILNIPCLTLRDTTERPITISEGTNVLVWHDTQSIIKEALTILNGHAKSGNYPPLWDGKTAERIVDIISREGSNKRDQGF